MWDKWQLYSTVSLIIPFNTLKWTISQEEDDHGIMGMKRGMLRSIADRNSDIKQQLLCALATLHDPRFKLKGFSTATHSMLLIQESKLWLSKLSRGSLASHSQNVPR